MSENAGNPLSLEPETQHPKESQWPKYRFCGETAVIVELGEGINPVVNRRVHQLSRRIAEKKEAGILSINPTYRSLLIQYDPWACSYEKLLMLVDDLLDMEENVQAGKDMMEIPVCYGLEFGPDIEEVASFHEMTVEDVIALHAAAEYQVYMIGFTPGFPYLGGLDPRLFTPRKQTPRTRVPAGSVGIADRQTGIYPVESPGGWQLIGRTPLKLFDPDRTPPFLVKAGTVVRFKPITKDEYASY